MLQKLKKPSGDSKPVDLPPPLSVDQMLADLSKLRPNDPLLKFASFDTALNDVEENPATDGASSGSDKISKELSILASLCTEIRDAGDLLEEKRMELKSLARLAVEKREELEGVISWSATEASGEEEADEAVLKDDLDA